MLKQRVRRRQYHTLEELKRIILEEWDRITMEEIRARISEMPWRCEQLVEFGGKPIKSELWWFFDVYSQIQCFWWGGEASAAYAIMTFSHPLVDVINMMTIKITPSICDQLNLLAERVWLT